MPSKKLFNDFFTAIIMGRLDTVKEIVSQDRDALNWVAPAGYPPLHMAILNAHPDLAVYFIEEGADLAQTERETGDTARRLAERKGMLDLLEAAAVAAPQKKRDKIEACGNDMHTGLKQRMSLRRGQLKIRPK